MEYDVKSLVIGLDLGGTNSVFGIVDGGGEIIATTSINNSSLKFEIMAKQLYVASQRVL